MADKLSEKDWERMNAYGHGYFYGRSGYELDSLWAPDEDAYKYVVQGFMDGHFDFCSFSDTEEFTEYKFGLPEDEDGKYVHIGMENDRERHQPD